MVEKFFGNSLWYLVKQSDLATKAVLFILLIMSVLCWAIFFYKLIVLRIKKRQMHDALLLLHKVETFESLLAIAQQLSQTVPGYFFAKTLLAVKRFAKTRGGESTQLLTLKEYEFVRETMESTGAELVALEESLVPVLSLSVSVAPLLGLFGTIWGLVQAFIEIGQKQSADIATIAPGIAEALVTTLGGLLVAIPAAIMFHWVAGKIRELERQIYQLADTIAPVLQQLCVLEEDENA